MDSHRPIRHIPYVSMAVASLALVLAGVPPAVGRLAYSPAAFAAGEWWRIVSCHVAHWSFDHALWDALAFLLAGSLAERMDRRGMIAVLGLSALVIPPLVLLVQPDLRSYAGLSGLDVALYAFALLRVGRTVWPSGGRLLRSTLLVAGLGLVAKIAFELLTGGLWFVQGYEGDFVPVPLAHLIGGVVGLAIGLRSSNPEAHSPAALPGPTAGPAALGPLHRVIGGVQ